MKKNVVVLFVLLFNFIMGCEDSTVNKPVEDVQKSSVNQKLEKTEAATRQQPVSQQQVKAVINKQVVDVNLQHDLKSFQSKTENKTELSDQSQDQKVLDLSVPIEIQDTLISEAIVSDEKENYLPDLFADKKKKKPPLQVDGKILNKVEEEADKERAVDGIGINIKLLP